eukprot:13618358-Ditylum_brightwellii.AAC.1
MTLNFNLLHERIYNGATASQVIAPDATGEYGVTADHVPVVVQLKAGVLQILHESAGEPEKYFMPGGFLIIHDNSVTVRSFFLVKKHAKLSFSLKSHAWSQMSLSLYLKGISCPEAIKVYDIDPVAVSSNFEAARNAYNAAEAGSAAQAEVMVDMEMYCAMGSAVGITLS